MNFVKFKLKLVGNYEEKRLTIANKLNLLVLGSNPTPIYIAIISFFA